MLLPELKTRFLLVSNTNHTQQQKLASLIIKEKEISPNGTKKLRQILGPKLPIQTYSTTFPKSDTSKKTQVLSIQQAN